MTVLKGKIENPMPVIDEGWWTSLLAEESRVAPQQIIEESKIKILVEQKREEVIAPPKEIKPLAVEKNPVSDWGRLKDLYMNDQIIEMSVTGFNRGGLLVEGEGLYGFVPFSHLIDLAGKPQNGARDHELESYVGRAIRLKVIECAPEDGRVVFSERAAQSQPGKRAELFHSLKAGQNVKGVVTNITDFGAFIDLGGVEGLIHISELSWGRVAHPASVVKLGDAVNAQVIDISSERCRVALSLKRLAPNPWTNAPVEFPEGCVKNATITSVLSFGAFARFETGLEGLIHSSEIPQADGKPLKEFLSEGQDVQVRVIHLDAARQRMGLSMRLEN